MIALIDGDIVLHRVGYTTDLEEEWIARSRTNEMLEGILGETDAKDFHIYLSDDRDRNFRKELSPAYKANRTAPRPRHYDFIKSHMIGEWGARISLGQEADDSLGIEQDKSGGETVICSIDKDLFQIPGQHFNFVKKEWECVEAWEGLKWFYQQILIGDVSDNVQGCKGIGPVKAGKAIHPIGKESGEVALFNTVKKIYLQKETGSPEEILSRLLLAGRLLKIRQQEEEPLWNFPVSNLTPESTLSSTQPTPAVDIPSTAHTTPENMDGFPSAGQRMEVISKERTPS